MDIQLYSFSKRKNSTKIPTGTGISVTAELKHSTSFEAPVFRLSASDIVGINIRDVTYIKEKDKSNYWFVDNCLVFPHDVYELYCSMDPMASHRSEILASTQYVIYSASSFDVNIADPRIVPNALGWQHNSMALKDINNNDLLLDSTGCYVLSVCNKEHSNNFVTYYLITQSNLKALASYIFSVGTWPTGFEQKMVALFSNAFGCIISLIWLPIPYSTASAGLTSYSEIYLGEFQVSGVSAYSLHPGDRVQLAGSCNPNWHYQNDWRVSEPFTKGYLYIPGFGMVDCNPKANYGVGVQTDIDLLTGDAVTYYEDYMVSVSYNLAVTIPIAQLSNNVQPAIGQIATGAFNTAVAGASGNVGGVVSGFAGNIKTAIDAFKSTPSYKGGLGGTAWLGKPKYMFFERYIGTTDLDSLQSTQGRPLMDEVTLSSLSGFCQCANASIPLNCYAGERDAINSMLNSGFYIE